MIGSYFSWFMHCRDNIGSSVFLQIRIGSIGRKTSRKTQWSVVVEFSTGCDTGIITHVMDNFKKISTTSPDYCLYILVYHLVECTKTQRISVVSYLYVVYRRHSQRFQIFRYIITHSLICFTVLVLKVVKMF